MYRRSKAIAIESVIVMVVLIMLAFVVFLVIRSGTGAYEEILDQKQNTESARVAYSYINMKIKQNDSDSLISVTQTKYGNTLKIDTGDGEFTTYIFFSDGALYECLTKSDMQPETDAANRITSLSGFSISMDGSYIDIVCLSVNGENRQTVRGTVGLRT